jgi:hypothetical protein
MVVFFTDGLMHNKSQICYILVGFNLLALKDIGDVQQLSQPIP